MNYTTIQHTGNRRSQFFFMGERIPLYPGQVVRVPYYEAEANLINHPDLFVTLEDDTIQPLFNFEQLDSLHGIWGDSDVFIVAGGPSVETFPVEHLKDRDCKTFAVNHSFDFWPWMDAVVFQDEQFLRRTKGDLSQYNGLVFARRATGYTGDAYFFPTNKTKVAKSFHEGLFSPLSSGMIALNASLLMTTGRIFLVGYDMTGRHFYPDDYHDSIIDYDTDSWRRAVLMFDKFIDDNNRIFNLSLKSKITAFKKVDYRDILH